VVIRFIAGKFPSSNRYIQALAVFETILHHGSRLIALFAFSSFLSVPIG